MTDREKLIELIGQVQDEGLDYSDVVVVYKTSNERLANHLINNGVTFAADNEETAHWEWYEHAYDWNLGGYVCSNCHMKNDNLPSFSKDKLDPYMFAGSHFCPCCGKRMVKEN